MDSPRRCSAGSMDTILNFITSPGLPIVEEDELADPRDALHASAAWNKLMLVHLNVLLIGYLLPPAAGN